MIAALLLAAATVIDTSSYDTLLLIGPTPIIKEAAKAAKACHAPIQLRPNGPGLTTLGFSRMTKHREARACLQIWIDANRDRGIEVVWIEDDVELL